MRRIRTKAELTALTKELGVAGDWHEPDNQDVTATVHGDSFDNAGFWPEGQGLSNSDRTEMHVILHKDGKPVAAVNLATLISWASGCSY